MVAGSPTLVLARRRLGVRGAAGSGSTTLASTTTSGAASMAGATGAGSIAGVTGAGSMAAAAGAAAMAGGSTFAGAPAGRDAARRRRGAAGAFSVGVFSVPESVSSIFGS